jgi:dTMP kinase
MFISFEGLDYSGKTTQAKLLVEYLTSQNHEVLFLREPGGTTISEKIRDILLDKKNSGMSDVTELLLFSSARAQLVHEVIVPAIAGKKIVVCDRFTDSTVAYQGYGRGIPLEDINSINRLATTGLTPDLTFFVDITVEEIARRQKAAGKVVDRMESANNDFFEKARNGYWMKAQDVPDRFVVVNGMMPVDEIQNEIRDIVMKRIKQT